MGPPAVGSIGDRCRLPLLAALLAAALLGCGAEASNTAGPATSGATGFGPAATTTPAPSRTPAASRLPIATPSPAPTPDPLLPVPGTTFKGKTSQGTKLVLTVGPGPTLVRPTKLTLDWSCNDGSHSEAAWELAPGQAEPLVEPRFDLFVGFQQGWSGAFSSPTAVAGTGRFVMEFQDISGKPMKCDTGEFHWSATATKVEPLPSFEGPIEATTVQQAIEAGYVDVEVFGVGASSGDSIVMTIGSRVEEALDLDLPEGSELRAGNRGAQDMVVRGVKGELDSPAADSYRPADSISLDPGEVANYLLEAYCLDFHRANPQASDAFTVRGPASPRIVRVLGAADEAASPPSIPALQAAIWALTDDVGRAELRARFSVSSADLRTARALIGAAGLEPRDFRLFR